MTIQIITGIPGSGKTCLALKILTDQFYHYDRRNRHFYLKPDYSDLTLITNITGLKLPHINLEEAMEQANLSFEKFFSVPYQQKISSKYKRIVYVIDECQRYIHRGLKDRDCIYYFDFHRHLGHDIYLITQDIVKIHKEIVAHHEFEFRLTKKALLAGEFRYLVKSSGDIIDRKAFKGPKKIFRLYKSFEAPTTLKTKNVFLKYLLVPIVIFVLFGFFFLNMINPSKKEAVAQPEVKRTEFASTKSPEPEPEPEPEITYTNLPIENFATLDGKLFYFTCPLSGQLYKTGKSPYDVFAKNGKYYAKIEDDVIAFHRASFEDSKTSDEENPFKYKGVASKHLEADSKPSELQQLFKNSKSG